MEDTTVNEFEAESDARVRVIITKLAEFVTTEFGAIGAEPLEVVYALNRVTGVMLDGITAASHAARAQERDDST